MEKQFSILVKDSKIFGILHLPEGAGKHPVVIMSHGYSNDRIGPWPYLFVLTARLLAENGIAVIRFDFRGSGDSEGKFENQNLDTQLEDLVEIISYAKDLESIDPDKIGLLGHSRGGAISFITASQDSSIRTLVTWAAPANWDDIWGNLAEKILAGEKSEFSSLVQTKQLVEIDQKYNPLTNFAKKIDIPWLIVHGKNDGKWPGEVPIKHAELLHNSSSSSELCVIPDTGHSFYEAEARRLLWNKTLSWFKTHLF